ncbi:uncharacterized protein G2W53_043851 [Senna tora]|uniref:Uncharacterized protein n=1 Tax=Senna tora TaxID=362788 RepID=A0A834W0U8_9FABA|nr:uncharacterized protein G2W53_043851 [Senna tora]
MEEEEYENCFLKRLAHSSNYWITWAMLRPNLHTAPDNTREMK